MSINKKLGIGIIIHGLYPAILAGKEKQAEYLAKFLSQKHNVYLFVRYHENHKTINTSYNIIQIKYPNIFLIRFIYVLFMSIYKVAKFRKKIDHLICFGTDIELLKGFLAHIIFQIPFTASIRGGCSYQNLSKFRKKIYNLYISKCKYVHVQTKKIRDDINKVFPNKKIVLIPNGIETHDIPYNRFEDRKNQVVFIGRLVKQNHGNDKGIRYLIESLKWIDNSVECLIIGDGPERDNLLKLANEKSVKFLGIIEPFKVFEYLSQSKVFVLPSIKGEGFPNVILEAMSVGTPPISTNDGGIPDIIQHGKTGFLVERENPLQISNHINQLIFNKETWEEISKNCIKEVKKYSWDSIGIEFEKLLKSL